MSKFTDAADKYVKLLERTGAGNSAPKVGDLMPKFLLPNEAGRLISLDELLDTAPIALAFHRGHWCPYGRSNAVGLAEVEEDIKPVRIVGISAEKQKYIRILKAETRAEYPFLIDFGNSYSLSINLAVWVDDELSSLMASAGRDVPTYQGHEGWILPIPSVFVVGQDGLIKSRHVYADFRRPLELSELKTAAHAAINGGMRNDVGGV